MVHVPGIIASFRLNGRPSSTRHRTCSQTTWVVVVARPFAFGVDDRTAGRERADDGLLREHAGVTELHAICLFRVSAGCEIGPENARGG